MVPYSGPTSRAMPPSSRWLLYCAALALLLFPVCSRVALAAPPQRHVVGGSRAVTIVPEVSQVASHSRQTPWTARIHIDQAGFLKPHFVNVNLRPGDVLRVRDAHGEVVEEITGRGPKDMGTFWGLSAFGDTLTVELFVSQAYAAPPFRIDQVLVGNTAFLTPLAQRSVRSVCGGQADYEDTACYQSDADKWANARASVGVMTVGGDPTSPDPMVGLWCSGVNISPDNLVLTNQHCILNQADCDNAEFVFNFRHTDCQQGTSTTSWKSYRCDAVLEFSESVGCGVTASKLDFSLQSVIGDPASTFGFAILDPKPVRTGEAVYIIQHPDGRPQEIVHGSGSNFIVDDAGLRYYGSLDTEGGSSGAPIFREADGKLVGLHQCGGCEVPRVGNLGIPIASMYPQLEPFLCSQSLALTGVEGVRLREFRGNGDSVIDPGEIWQFRPRIRNTSCSLTATGVVARVRVSPASRQAITLLNTDVDFGTVAAGRTVLSQNPIRFQVKATTACDSQLLFDLNQIKTSSNQTFPNTPKVLTAVVGAAASTTLLAEDFAAGIPPTWSVIDQGTGTGPAATWTTTNPGLRTLGLTAPFVIADSGTLIGTMDEQLISPLVNAADFAHLTLQFSHVFNWYYLGREESATVEVRSSATQNQWVTVAQFGPGDVSGVVRIDLTAQAAGQPDVQIRFRYSNAASERWWAIDDIFLLADNGVVCQLQDRIFADSFETGDTRAWDQKESPNRFDLIVTPTAALAGTSQGLQLTVDDRNPVYLQDNAPAGEPHYRIRFYLDPTGLVMPDPSHIRLLALLDADHDEPELLTVVLRFHEERYWLSVFPRLDDHTWVRPAFVPLEPGAHHVEIAWAKASNSRAHDGMMKLWIDDVPVTVLENLDNYTRKVDFMRLGVVNKLPAGVSGMIHFDHIETRRHTYIGP